MEIALSDLLHIVGWGGHRTLFVSNPTVKLSKVRLRSGYGLLGSGYANIENYFIILSLIFQGE